mgnify:CR=1 FL=1
MVVDYAGPGELVTKDTGFKLPLGPRDEIIAELRKALEGVLADPSVLPAMGRAAQERVLRDFTWDAKARQIARVYDWILQGQPEPAPVLLPG